MILEIRFKHRGVVIAHCFSCICVHRVLSGGRVEHLKRDDLDETEVFSMLF